jgi:hypothetical protein
VIILNLGMLIFVQNDRLYGSGSRMVFWKYYMETAGNATLRYREMIITSTFLGWHLATISAFGKRLMSHALLPHLAWDMITDFGIKINHVQKKFELYQISKKLSIKM